MDEDLRERMKELILTDEEKDKLSSGRVWPRDKYYVPPMSVNDESFDSHRTVYINPSEKDAMFYMPPAEYNFPCHDCGCAYGPWVHDGFTVNVDGGYGSKPIYANILHKRRRWCEECGREHFNCYAVGKVFFERKASGALSFDYFGDDR